MERTNGIENELIEGRNAITEALRAGRPIDKIFISGGDGDRTLGFISTIAREKGITVVECDRRKLDSMSETHAHQGVIALAAVAIMPTRRYINGVMPIYWWAHTSSSSPKTRANGILLYPSSYRYVIAIIMHIIRSGPRFLNVIRFTTESCAKKQTANNKSTLLKLI